MVLKFSPALQNFWGLILKFVEVTGEKLVGRCGAFCTLPALPSLPPNLNNFDKLDSFGNANVDNFDIICLRCSTTTTLFQKAKFYVMQPLVYFSFSRWIFQNHSLLKNIRPNEKTRGYSWKKIWKIKRAVSIRMLSNLFGKNNCASSYNHLTKVYLPILCMFNLLLLIFLWRKSKTMICYLKVKCYFPKLNRKRFLGILQIHNFL